MVFNRQTTQLKNRMHANLENYGFVVEEASDAFGKKGRAIVEGILVKLPPYTEQAVRRVLGQLDHVNENLKVIEAQMMEACGRWAEINLVKSVRGVGDVVEVVV